MPIPSSQNKNFTEFIVSHLCKFVMLIFISLNLIIWNLIFISFHLYFINTDWSFTNRDRSFEITCFDIDAEQSESTTSSAIDQEKRNEYVPFIDLENKLPAREPKKQSKQWSWDSTLLVGRIGPPRRFGTSRSWLTPENYSIIVLKD